MSERNWYDDVMGFFGQDAQSVIGGRQEDPVTGKVKAGFGDFLAGRSQAELDSAYDAMKQTQRRKKGRQAFEDSGYTSAELGGIDPDNTTHGAVTSAVRRVEEGKRDDSETTSFTRSLAPLQLQMQQQGQQFNATMQRTLAQDARNYQLQLQTAADNKEARADELEFRRMEARREDQRYNERMEQLDRKDRRAAMSSLAGGLAALGAAFAL